MKTWIVKAQCPGKQPVWLGPFDAPGRNEAKREARLYVSRYLPLDAKVICIAEGTIKATVSGPEIPIDE